MEKIAVVAHCSKVGKSFMVVLKLEDGTTRIHWISSAEALKMYEQLAEHLLTGGHYEEES